MIESLGQVALTVRDVERSVAFYRDALGLRFLFAPARMPDHELWMCFLRDPDGHTLALMCERRPAV
jgi:methylmalonyl-CoA/ethylmalonyl-CoA epimerase